MGGVWETEKKRLVLPPLLFVKNDKGSTKMQILCVALTSMQRDTSCHPINLIFESSSCTGYYCFHLAQGSSHTGHVCGFVTEMRLFICFTQFPSLLVASQQSPLIISLTFFLAK
ncbi:hypothetical protein AMECASPLE_038241 [Ameca splendens]|uniref:Uncharacterized protein n=1 Tax=Ameca splendens TaxID=208324 RepID=A0ABV0XL75_9TELE